MALAIEGVTIFPKANNTAARAQEIVERLLNYTQWTEKGTGKNHIHAVGMADPRRIQTKNCQKRFMAQKRLPGDPVAPAKSMCREAALHPNYNYCIDNSSSGFATYTSRLYQTICYTYWHYTYWHYTYWRYTYWRCTYWRYSPAALDFFTSPLGFCTFPLTASPQRWWPISPRRIMASTPAKSRTAQSPSASPSETANAAKSPAKSPARTPTRALAARCPICGETTPSLAALNSHIDHKHADTPPSPVRTPQKRTLKLDLYDNNMGFGLSDRVGGESAALTRAHWKHPAPGATAGGARCSHPQCGRALNVKNGVVNCRRCGELFCNHHTRFQVRLRNAAGSKSAGASSTAPEWPVYDLTGDFARCCDQCFYARPGRATQVGERDVTAEFVARRAAHAERRQAARAALQRRFLKLVHLYAQNGAAGKAAVAAQERDLLGPDWQDDAAVSHCPLCFVEFGFFVRKHHCRLCGAVVSDAAYNSRDPIMACSREVPVGVFMERLPRLNYSPLVRQNWDRLRLLPQSFRCCRTCKDTLVAGDTGEKENTNDLDSLKGPEGEVLMAYNELLAIKSAIQAGFLRYDAMDAEGQARLRVRLRKHVKDFEVASVGFRRRFFAVNTDSGKYRPTQAPVLVTNVYNMALAFLQESLLQLKRLNDDFLRHTEQMKRDLAQAGGLPSALTSAALLPPKPRLTLRQIRELREELMVANEQRFLVEKLVEEATRQRRFDELQTLADNISDLTSRIHQLETELGEFGFA